VENRRWSKKWGSLKNLGKNKRKGIYKKIKKIWIGGGGAPRNILRGCKLEGRGHICLVP